MKNAYVHIIRNPLKPYDRTSDKVPAGTRVIDWLQKVAPTGFGMPIRLFVNQKELAVIDSDRALQAGDVCACVVTPGYIPGAELLAIYSAALTKIKAFAIYAAVTIGTSLAVNALFGPKPPKSQRGPNPVYDIGASNNQSRLGEPIPVVYGEDVVTVPDFAQPPYVFFSKAQDDQMYVDQLFCLGVGKYVELTDDDILIGDTPASGFPPGVIQFKQFQLNGGTGAIGNHNGVLGAMENQLWQTGDFGVDEFKFFEDIYTAPDITDWEFRDDEVRGTTVDNYAADVTDLGFVVEQNRHQVQIRTVIETKITAGKTFNITGTTFDGQYTCVAAVPDYTTGSGTPPDIDYTHVFLTCWAPIGVVPVTGPATISVTLNTVSSQAQTGWYAAQPLGRTVRDVYVDFAAPRGLFKVKSNSGTRVYLPDQYAPDMLLEGEEIDPTTGLILNEIVPGSGFKLQQTLRMNGRLPDPQRRTAAFVTADVVTIPPGQVADDWRNRAYVVRMTARHEFLDNDRYQQSVMWVGLKGILSKPVPNEVYGNVTLIAMRMRGTNGISQQAQQRVKVRCSRIYTLQDDTVGVSSNPVDAINDIYRDPEHGFNRPADEVNAAFLTKARGLWLTENVTFKGVYLQDVTGWEALETALLPAVAKPAYDSGQLTIVADKKKPITSFLFNNMSIVTDSYGATFTIDNSDETDGVEIEFRDPLTFDPAYVRYPTTSSKPQRLVYIGVTDETYAGQLAHLYWNRLLYQRHNCTFQTEMQGMVPLIGDKISVSTPVLQSGFSGRVVGLNSTTVILDQRILWGTDVEISFTQPDQSPTAYYAITKGNDFNIATLGTPVVENLDMSMLRTPTSYHIRSAEHKPRDMLITNIRHDGKQLFTIDALSYPEDDELGDNPLFEGGPGHLILDWDGTPL